jgi:hypothetical protein
VRYGKMYPKNQPAGLLQVRGRSVTKCVTPMFLIAHCAACSATSTCLWRLWSGSDCHPARLRLPCA